MAGLGLRGGRGFFVFSADMPLAETETIAMRHTNMVAVFFMVRPSQKRAR
jgi:hypothetical protein